ncbi:hypothetical protein BAC2_03679 [uncultured bacterium]|nr:hypothetical protein BAC2_03679 [uncultured bacterium]
MADKSKPRGARARAIIVQRAGWQPTVRGAEFKSALFDDLRELVSAMGLALAGPREGASGTEIRALLETSRDTTLVLFSDIPGLPPLSVEGALDSLREYPCALGPCADGGIYLLAFSPEMNEKVKVALVEAASVSPSDAMNIVTDLLTDEEINCGVLPPWFRVANERDFQFADNLARLSLLSEEGEDDFVCDRLRVWFEQQE